MVATFFYKNLSRWQVVAMKVLIKKKFQVSKTKFCGAAKYKTAVNKEWFNDDDYKGIFNHSNIDSLYSACPLYL